jgi:sigma-B regulation protein RsbU (phosphoserine phosphatase)
MDSPVSRADPARPCRVLVCDDQPDVLEALRLLLKGQGYQAVTVDSPQALLAAARAQRFDLILADLNYTRDTTSGGEGLDLLASIEQHGIPTPVIVMTAWGSVDLAVEAMRRGACDFIQKPWENARVIAAIRRHTESERRRRSELEIAAGVQRNLFPHGRRRLATIDYAGRCIPARDVSGDYYDFLDLDEGRLAFVLADVAGKGVPAALLMANLQACFRSQSSPTLENPAALLQTVNRLFYESTSPERFATLFFCLYDDRTRALRYVNCGHVAPLLIGSAPAAAPRRLNPTATVIGAFPAWTCQEAAIALAPGDTLLLYTDGVTEAGIDRGEEYGDERLAAALVDNRRLPIDALVSHIADAAVDFGHGSQSDDVTVVGIRAL